MKIFAFDNEGSCGGGGWKKCWASLGDIEVHKCSTIKSRANAVCSIETSCKIGTALLLVHQGECESNAHNEVTLLLSSCPSLFVMYVSGGAQNGNDDSASPRVHYSHRIVPSGPKLGYLEELFSKLCTSLSTAGTDINKIRRAWEEWESPVLSRLITVMAPLALEPSNETLANSIANNIHKDLRHAADELCTDVAEHELAEHELKEWLLTPYNPENYLLEWIQKYPQAMLNLARRGL